MFRRANPNKFTNLAGGFAALPSPSHTRTVEFDDDWVNEASRKEASARDRDLESKRQRWAELDRADLQGKGEAVQRAKRARRSERWRKSWPWLVFFAVAAVLIAGARILGW